MSIYRFPNEATQYLEEILLLIRRANLGNWNILVPRGKENNLMISWVVASESERVQTIMV